MLSVIGEILTVNKVYSKQQENHKTSTKVAKLYQQSTHLGNINVDEFSYLLTKQEII